MTEHADYLRKTLGYYKQQREKKLVEMRPHLDQLRELEMMIRQLERELGDAPSLAPNPSEIPLALADGFSMKDSVLANNQNNASVRPDEFFTMTQSEAAKAYLKKVGRAIPFEELVAALKKGGARLGGSDPSHTLYVSLARNPHKEFVWPSTDHIGLSEFYGSRTRASAVPGKRVKKAKRSRTNGATTTQPAKAARPARSKDAKKPSDVALAIEEVMKDGQARSKDEIVKAVTQKLGRKVAPISVHGTLVNGKKYEQVDGGQFRHVTG